MNQQQLIFIREIARTGTIRGAEGGLCGQDAFCPYQGT